MARTIKGHGGKQFVDLGNGDGKWIYVGSFATGPGELGRNLNPNHDEPRAEYVSYVKREKFLKAVAKELGVTIYEPDADPAENPGYFTA